MVNYDKILHKCIKDSNYGAEFMCIHYEGSNTMSLNANEEYYCPVDFCSFCYYKPNTSETTN
jgi:hypothetical protein